MAETKILDIDFGDLFARITEIRNATKSLKEENIELKKSISDGKGSVDDLNKALTQNEAKLRDLGREQKVLNKVVDDSIKLEKAQKGSIEANRAELSKLTAEYVKLAKPTAEQTARIKELSDTLKKQEAALGDTRRNVGNYQAAIEGALGKVRIFGVSIGDTLNNLKGKKQELTLVKNSLVNFGGGLGSASNALNIFKVALAATGVGLLIVALGALATFLTKTEKGIELVNKVTTILGATFNVIVGRVAQLAEGIGYFLEGKWSKAVDTVKGSFTGLTSEIVSATKAASALADAQERLEDAEIGFIESRAKLRAQIQDLRDIANDETKSFKERTNALKDALKIQEELSTKEAEIASIRIANAQTEFNLSAKRDEDKRKLAETNAAAFEDERDRTKEKIKLENELTTLVNKTTSERNAKEKELLADRKKREDEEKEQKQKRLKEQLEDSKTYFDEQETIEKENYLNGVINKEEFNRRMGELKQSELEDQINILDDFGQQVAEKEAELENLKIDNKLEAQERYVEEQAEINERIKELNQDLMDAEADIQQAKIDLAGASLAIIEDFAKEESAIARLAFLGTKAVAIAEVIVSAQKGFLHIASNLAAVPPVIGVIPNPLYPYAAAIAIKEQIALGIQTGISIATIGAQAVKGFLKEGGEFPTPDGKVYNIGGRSHTEGGTKYFGEDGNVIEMEKGEKAYVLKKEASEAIEKYSMLNQLYGGRSWTGRPPVRHAALGGEVASQFDGGYTARNSAANVNAQIASELLRDAMRNMPTPVVRVTEINRVQAGVEQAVQVSEL